MKFSEHWTGAKRAIQKFELRVCELAEQIEEC
jgi:hypothetical protein